MRTLNDYFLLGGGMSAIQTPANASDTEPVVPDAGKLQAVFMHITALNNDSAVTFNIFKNGTDTTIDATLPINTPANTGVELALGGNVYLAPGDKLGITSNGETNVATLADLIYVIRR